MSKEDNRKQFPVIAAFIDDFRKVFGPDVKLLWAKEGDKEIGKRFEERLAEKRDP